ncbi:MAG: Npt1/Npt2 family nucleotide transporter, partial [Gemmatimonadota bacterium]
YLTSYPVETLPYITAAVALLSVPTVGLFARRLSRGDPQRVLTRVIALLAAALAVLWPFATRFEPAVVVFYLVTALGTLLLTSGFWLITAELFPIRGAKRLFGLIGAGGTAGAMVIGNTIAWLTDRFDLAVLVPGLVVLLGLFLIVQAGLPRVHAPARPGGEEGRSSIREGFALVWKTPYLRTIALLVASATIASTLVDYQFKDLASESLTSREALAGFFGAFYGWTGAASLAIQVLLTARLMASAGLTVALAVLPVVLLLGSAGLLLVPGLLVATLVRAGDNSLRKSLHRSVLEVLFVPMPTAVRRKTKTFIDSVADSAAEGIGAAIVFAVVTLGGLPSRGLSLFVLALAGVMLWLARRAGRGYVTTVTEQLQVGVGAGSADQRDLLSASFARVDIRPALEEAGVAIATADLTADVAAAAALFEELRAGADEG